MVGPCISARIGGITMLIGDPAKSASNSQLLELGPTQPSHLTTTPATALGPYSKEHGTLGMVRTSPQERPTFFREARSMRSRCDLPRLQSCEHGGSAGRLSPPADLHSGNREAGIERRPPEGYSAWPRRDLHAPG